uniref:DUF58 domain-containing protein n=1 Tax=Pelomonas sp. KK5 TaxID=1855730 RepID=UPI00097C6F48
MNPRQRWQEWWQRRHPPRDTHALEQRNIYIVPTRAGLAFCLTLGVLLLASINDQLSLGYMLTFLLAGSGLASMHTTHGNLRGLNLDLKAPAPVFAGGDVELEIRLHNPGRSRHGIGLRVQGAPEGEIAWTDVPARGHATLALRYPAPARGLHGIPTLQIITRFPLGLFRAWSYWRPAARAWVYPQPEAPVVPFPLQSGAEGEAEAAATGRLEPGQEFEGVRLYRRGDPLRQVLWKKAALSLAQGTPPWVRETAAPLPQSLWLEEPRALPEREARLSRLAA